MIRTVVLFGPTASGKTNLSIELSKQLNGEIISADSMQVYRFMDIGTAKPSKEQRKTVPHHLIDIINPDENWTVSEFIDRSSYLIKDIRNRRKRAIIVGGTGLYLNAFINGYSFPLAEKDEKIREKLSRSDVKELFSKLQEADPDSAKKINSNDKKRIIRALEVYEQTGIPISKLQKRSPNKELTLICLNDDREKIYENINKRVDEMMKKGLLEEVKKLLEMGYSKELTSMQALGYKELIGYLNKEYDLDNAVDLIKKKTRNFARRQLTWFRRFEGVNWIEADQKTDATVKEIIDLIQTV